MSSVSFKAPAELAVGPEVQELPVGPDFEESTIGPSVESTSSSSSSFDRLQQKFFPITRKLMTGSWNGSLQQLSAVKKVFAVFVGSLLSLITSLFTLPIVAMRKMQIKAFNDLPVVEKMNKSLLGNLDQVIEAAKEYRESPDSHKKKLTLEESNRTLAASIDKIRLEFPEQAETFEQLIRAKIEEELGALLISIKPQSSQDQHRFTFPLASLVLDGFFPMINGAPNPLVRGVAATSITYQFEEGIFTASPERLMNRFFSQMENDPKEAVDSLLEGLESIKRPTKQEAEDAKVAIKAQIAEKLNDPTAPERQKFTDALRRKVDQEITADNQPAITPERLQALGAALTDANILSEGQSDVLLAQVQGDRSTPSVFAEEAQAKAHATKARRAALSALGLGALVALRNKAATALVGLAGRIPPNVQAQLMKAIPEGLKGLPAAFGVKAQQLLTNILGKPNGERLAAMAPKASVAAAAAALGLYGLYHALKARKGSKLTPGQKAAQSFAKAIEKRNDAIEKARDAEFQAVEKGVAEGVGQTELLSFKRDLAKADALVKQAEEALEDAVKNPTPELIDRTVDLSKQAAQQYEQAKKQSELLAAAVDKAEAGVATNGASGKPNAHAVSYLDLGHLFRKAKKFLKRVDQGLEASQGLSDRGGNKIDELQQDLRRKVQELAIFEAGDLEQARSDIVQVEILEQEIENALVAKKANPKKAKTWELSLSILRQDVACRKERVQDAQSKHERLKGEIARLRAIIVEMGSSPAA